MLNFPRKSTKNRVRKRKRKGAYISNYFRQKNCKTAGKGVPTMKWSFLLIKRHNDVKKAIADVTYFVSDYN